MTKTGNHKEPVQNAQGVFVLNFGNWDLGIEKGFLYMVAGLVITALVRLLIGEAHRL